MVLLVILPGYLHSGFQAVAILFNQPGNIFCGGKYLRLPGETICVFRLERWCEGFATVAGQ